MSVLDDVDNFEDVVSCGYRSPITSTSLLVCVDSASGESRVALQPIIYTIELIDDIMFPCACMTYMHDVGWDSTQYKTFNWEVAKGQVFEIESHQELHHITNTNVMPDATARITVMRDTGVYRMLSELGDESTTVGYTWGANFHRLSEDTIPPHAHKYVDYFRTIRNRHGDKNDGGRTIHPNEHDKDIEGRHKKTDPFDINNSDPSIPKATPFMVMQPWYALIPIIKIRSNDKY